VSLLCQSDPMRAQFVMTSEALSEGKPYPEATVTDRNSRTEITVVLYIIKYIILVYYAIALQTRLDCSNLIIVFNYEMFKCLLKIININKCTYSY
jgi:hypothetical protein